MAPMIVMGLFGFIGKAVKGVAKGIGAVAKVGIGVAKFGLASGLLPIPGGGLIGKASSLLLAKRPMSTTMQKFPMSTPILRAKSPLTRAVSSVARLQQLSPVLPGGAIATVRGPVPQAGTPPLTFSGAASTTVRRKRKKSKRRKSSYKRRSRGRKLKFGSPAWRKKYLGHGRRKRRRAA